MARKHSDRSNDKATRFFRSLISILQAIKSGIDEQTKAMREEQKAAGRSEEPPAQRPVDPVVSLPPAISGYYEAEQRDRPLRERREIIKRRVEFVGITAAVAVAVLTYCTLRQVQRQADSAGKQVEIMRQQVVIQERPVIKIRHRILKPLTFGVPAGDGPIAQIQLEDTL